MSTDVANRKGEGRGKGTDGGSEGVEEVGETDHLRSVGRQHKPVGEGRSPLDSVLQRDEKRDRERGGDEEENGSKRDKERTENGQNRHGERYRENVKELDRNWLSCREPSGGKITQGVGKIWVVISQFFKMPVRPRCLHQILTTCQTNHFVVHYNCSCLCIMQKQGVCVCLSVLQESVPDNIKKLRTG